jgi:O-antigen/teichoic acid export membrane protein
MNLGMENRKPGWPGRRLLGRIDLDRATAYTLLTRSSQAISGAVTLLLIAHFFSPELQGYYYIFASLLALQSFLELGFYVVITNLVSHEWSGLELDESGAVIGTAEALSRLAGITRFVAKWYAAISLLFFFGVGAAGYVFISQSQSSGVPWQGPWIAAMALAAIQLWLMPMLSLLEGCNQVVAVNHFRLVQTIAEALVMWVLLAAGAGLWVTVGSLGVKVVAALTFLKVKYRRFFQSVLATSGLEQVHWKTEIWPMQWRLGVQGAMNYLMFSLFNPVMFHYHGPVVAGQMGMTLQVIAFIQLMSLAWVQTKVPRLGMLAARREYAEMDRVWWQASKWSLGFAIAGSLIAWMTVLILSEYRVNVSSRVLGPLPTALFLAAYGLQLISLCQGAYLRAYAREPFLVVGVLGGPLIACLVLFLGRDYGPTGTAVGYLIAVGAVLLPMTTLIWIRRRSDWQSRPVE